MIGSVTELGTFRRCRWQHRYGSFNGRALTRIIAPTALSLGSLIHAAHARWELEPTLPLWTIFMEEAARQEQQTRQAWRDRFGTPVRDEDMAKFFDLVDLGRAMCVNYEEYYGTSLPEGFRVIEPEQTLIVEVPGTGHDYEWNWLMGDWLKCPHEQLTLEVDMPSPDDPTGVTTVKTAFTVPACSGYHSLEGTLDALMEDTDTELQWIRERKTYKNRPSLPSLDKSDQFLGYLWLERMVHLNSEIKLGGLAYDGMWKRKQPPDRIKDAVTRKFRPGILDDLFLRRFLTRSETAIDGYHTALIAQLFDIAGRHPNPPTIYPNRAWQGCWDCSFEELCAAEMDGEDTLPILMFYTLRDPGDRDELYQDIDEIEIPTGAGGAGGGA